MPAIIYHGSEGENGDKYCESEQGMSLRLEGCGEINFGGVCSSPRLISLTVWRSLAGREGERIEPDWYNPA